MTNPYLPTHETVRMKYMLREIERLRRRNTWLWIALGFETTVIVAGVWGLVRGL